jgi:hypothetical protein
MEEKRHGSFGGVLVYVGGSWQLGCRKKKSKEKLKHKNKF